MPDLNSIFALSPPDSALSASAGTLDALLSRLAGAGAIRRLVHRLHGEPCGEFLNRLLAELRLSVDVSPSDVERVPRTGPVVVVSNHPFGLLEGAVLGTVLAGVRSDVKILANSLLADLPALSGLCIWVDPFGETSARWTNSRALRQAVEWLRAGRMLVVFPAGEVSHWQFRHGAVTDPPWSEAVARLVRIGGSAVLPVYFKGANSLPFHLLGMLHPRLRTVQLPKELLKQSGHTVELRIGTLISAKELAGIPTDRDAIHYLRWRTYLLANRGEPVRRLVPKLPLVKLPARAKTEVAVETPAQKIDDEVRSLRPDQLIDESGGYAVYLTTLQQTPYIVREIGRLREIAFRQAGEGSGKELDLDLYDSYYQHLFLWNKSRREIVGAYRLVRADRVLRRLGVDGLYTASLFHFQKEFFQRVGPAFELGRSFVRCEYQRQYAPLLGLWRGVARLVARSPEAPVLFGAASISDNYHPLSRRLLAAFLQYHEAHGELAHLVRPRRRPRETAPRANERIVAWLASDVESLVGPIGDIEADGKRVPVLIRQYLKMGGKLLSLAVDPAFSNTLDALLLVDLRATRRPLLERYMPPAEVESFLAFHRQSGPTSRRIAS